MRKTVGSIYTESIQVGSVRYKYQIKKLQQSGRMVGIRKFVGTEPVVELYEDLPSFIADYWRRQADVSNVKWITERSN